MKRLLILLLLLLTPSPLAAQVVNASRINLNGTWVTVGSAAPESSVTGSPGDLYIRTNGSLYIKATGSNTNTGWSLMAAGTSSGTVTSVGLSLPGTFAVSGSPVTTSGTLTASFAAQSAKTFFSGPASGSAATPTWRQPQLTDLGQGGATVNQVVAWDGTQWAAADNSGTGAPVGAQYLTLTTDGTLTNERVLTAGAGITATDAGAGSTLTLAADGANITSLSAANISAGTLAVARGGTNLTSATDDNVMVGNGTTWQSKSVPDCTDTGGNHLNYTQGTNAFSCGTSGGGTGTVTATGTLTSGKAIIGNGTTDVTVSSASGVAHLSSGTLTGSNVNVASEITGTTPVANGGTNLTSATDDNVMVGNGTTWQSKALADCDAATNAVTYDTSTNTFGCNTITGTGGGGIGTVTNTGTLTSGTFVVGNGSSDIKVATSQVLPGANGGGLVLLEQHTASSSASLDFTTAITSAYDVYQIEFVNIVPATNAVALRMRMSTNGGSSYDSGANYTNDEFGWRSGGSGLGGGTPQNQILIGPLNGANGISSSTSYGLVGSVKLYNPLSTSLNKMVMGQVMDFESTSVTLGTQTQGVYLSATAVNAFQFLMNSGNIASGTIRVYGLAK